MQREDRFVYFTAIDISVENGAGINEREFVKELMIHQSGQVVCVALSCKSAEIL